MTASEEPASYSLPTITNISFHNFDLYTEQPDVSVSMDKKVFCLIGANGLGKTTFLNTLIFAMTGAVPDPARKFLSAQKYYREASRPEKTADYFDGRISEKNRSTAGVTVELSWPNGKIRVTRNFFADSEITALHISRNDLLEPVKYDSTNIDSRTDLQGIYAKNINELTGLKDYVQFVFIVHFILTFDEGRHLLMWDDVALTDALYLAFGGDPELARKADKLRDDMNRADSRGRNTKYAAKLLADRMKILSDATQGSNETDDEADTSDILIQHAELQDRFKDTEARCAEKRLILQDTELKWTEASASLSEVQIEYQKLFSNYFQESSFAHHHPLIKATLSEDQCAICTTKGVAAHIKDVLADGNCPLCSSALEPQSNKNKDTDQLKTLDKRILQLREQISALLTKRDRVDAEHQAAMNAVEAANEALTSFEGAIDDSILMSQETASTSAVSQELLRLEKEHTELTKESRALYDKRDEIRKEMRGLEAKLSKQYDHAANTFVPRFRALAENFIGIDIDIHLKHHQSKTKSGFGLTLSMAGEPRQRAITVSESQGFFIDIALRMALAEYMCSGPATLLIDTPEGSLDIAYEARAGSMFANFTDAQNHILMTANLRSSELVLRLAGLQGRSDMQIERMTEWTELSAVQKEEDVLFQGAYDRIAKALGDAE